MRDARDDRFGPQRAIVFCPPCATSHLAEVHLDSTGFPVTEFLEPHTGTETTEARDRDAALDQLGRAAGEAVALLLDAGHLEAADRVAGEALELNDPEDGEEGRRDAGG